MKYELERILVDCLRNTINVMVCNDGTSSGHSVERLIRHFPIFSMFVAKSAPKAAQLARQVDSWNAIVMGPNCSFERECIALAAEQGRWVPVIAVLDPLSQGGVPRCVSRDTVATVWQEIDGTRTRSAQDFSRESVTTCGVDDQRNLLSVIQLKAIQNRLLHTMPIGTVRLAMEVLFRDNPLTVDDWCSALDMSPRKFQREFKCFTNLTPKKLVALYHAYRIAFETLDDQKERVPGVIPAYILDTRSKTRVMEYVLTRRSTLFT